MASSRRPVSTGSETVLVSVVVSSACGPPTSTEPSGSVVKVALAREVSVSGCATCHAGDLAASASMRASAACGSAWYCSIASIALANRSARFCWRSIRVGS